MVDRIAGLVAAIKAKKGLGTLDDTFVREKLERVLRGDARIARKLEAAKSVEQFLRSSTWDEILKRVRKELRAVYGVFQSGDREALLSRLAQPGADTAGLIEDLLETHVSTKERVPHYARIARELAARIVPAPKIIVDLGCGMNPLAHHYWRSAGWNPTWIASDVSEADMRFLAAAFKTLDIRGKSVRIDLLSETEEVTTLKGDVTFLLKLLDSLEESKRHISYALFDAIRTPWIVASFPTKSIGGGKRISTAGRTWFERLLTRKNATWETFSVENEFVYVIRHG